VEKLWQDYVSLRDIFTALWVSSEMFIFVLVSSANLNLFSDTRLFIARKGLTKFGVFVYRCKYLPLENLTQIGLYLWSFDVKICEDILYSRSMEKTSKYHRSQIFQIIFDKKIILNKYWWSLLVFFVEFGKLKKCFVFDNGDKRHPNDPCKRLEKWARA